MNLLPQRLLLLLRREGNAPRHTIAAVRQRAAADAQPRMPVDPVDYDLGYDAAGWEPEGVSAPSELTQPGEDTLLSRGPGLDGGPGFSAWPCSPRRPERVAAPGVLSTGPFPAVTPGSLLTPEDFQRPAPGPAPAAEPAALVEESATFTPDFAETGNLDRPYAPSTSQHPGAARLLAMTDGTFHSAAPLEDYPHFVALRTTEDGQTAAAVCIGLGAFGRILFETSRVDVLDALEAAARLARDKLVYADRLSAPAVPQRAPVPPVPAEPEPADITRPDIHAVPAAGGTR